MAQPRQIIPDAIKLDKRLIERHVSTGMLQRDAADRRVAALADLTDRADRIDLDQLAAAGRGERQP